MYQAYKVVRIHFETLIDSFYPKFLCIANIKATLSEK